MAASPGITIAQQDITGLQEHATMQASDFAGAVQDFSIRSAATQFSNVILQGKQGSLSNYRISVNYAERDNDRGGRHRHNFEQIRFPMEGEFIYTKDKVVPTGSVAYFPEGAYYGPQLRRKGTRMMVCQFGGASGHGYLGIEQRQASYEALSAKGHFEKGYYTYKDEDGKRHNQDAFEAVWEHAMGKKLEYPTPRYPDVVIMNPANFSWVGDANMPGVERKWIGKFTERNTRIGFIRVDAGATLTAGQHDAPEVLFLVSGSVHCQDRTYAKHSAFGFEPGEGEVPIAAKEVSEICSIQFPKF
jgi:hypothetical protein